MDGDSSPLRIVGRGKTHWILGRQHEQLRAELQQGQGMVTDEARIDGGEERSVRVKHIDLVSHFLSTVLDQVWVGLSWPVCVHGLYYFSRNFFRFIFSERVDRYGRHAISGQRTSV